MRWKADEVDIWCAAWAQTRRKIHGITLAIMLEPSERLGKLACTLGRVKEEAEGASSAGVVNQNWPEVYCGMALLVHRAWYSMPNQVWRLIQDAHYVWKEIPVREKAPMIPIAPRDYWLQLDLLKAHLAGYVQSNRDAEEIGYRLPRSATAVRYFG
jgi:hypothetical protein